VLEWIKDYGESYLNTHQKLGSTQQETEALLREHHEFRARAKVIFLYAPKKYLAYNVMHLVFHPSVSSFHGLSVYFERVEGN
jgi:hypothetical protein